MKPRPENELHGLGRVMRLLRAAFAQPAWKQTKEELADIAKRPLPASWIPHLKEFRQLRAFDPQRTAKFHADLSVLGHAIDVRSSEHFKIDDRMRVMLCGTAALLVTGRNPRWFDHISHFDVHRRATPRGGHDHLIGRYHGKEHPLLGVLGHVQVAWNEVEYDLKIPDDGNNVVLHELAHAIDHRFGGRLLERDARVTKWRAAARELASTWSTAPDVDGSELFAVVTELLFERPRDLRATEASLYAELVAIYGVDPITWT